MKASVSRSNSQFGFHTDSVSNREHRQRSYQRVFDERKRPIRGLWVRNGRYYAQLAILNEDTGETKVRRVPLEGATTPAQARSKMEELRVETTSGHAVRNGKNLLGGFPAGLQRGEGGRVRQRQGAGKRAGI